MTMLDKFNAFPPCLCRLVARNGRRPLSHREIARAAKMSVDTVIRLSLKKNWVGVKIDVAVRFAGACGVNHAALKKPLNYARRRTMAHIHRGTKVQRQFYARIFAA